jgi:spore coat polysaccharide biosynthesis predicted glycosyltransferase SpsG
MEFVCNQLGSGSDTQLVIIDSKLADAHYVNEIRKHAVVCCIQDEDPPEVPADIILNNHVDSEKWYGNPSDGQVRLLGPRFNLIHPAFFESAREKGRNNILVTFGGSDPQNHSLWVVNHLRDLFSHHPVNLVLGPSHPDPCAVIKAVRLNANFEVSVAPTTLIPFARQAFLAICAGGTTCYELLAAGLVLSAIAVEPHQRWLIDALDQHRAVLDLGGPGPLDPSDSMRKIQKLLDSDRLMREQRDAGTALFPRSGLWHVVNELTREIPPRWKANR